MRFRSTFLRLSVVVLLAGFTAGCKKQVAVAPPPPRPQSVEAPPPLLAPTASIVAEPATINQGETSTLRWSSSDATELTVTGLGVVEPEGSREVSPAESTTYTLIATGPGGSTSVNATVTVNVPPTPPVPVAKSLEERVGELADAYFDYDKSGIRDDAQAALWQDSIRLRSILSDFSEAVIYLEADCDERGSAEYNVGLGDRRASSASDFLQNLGVDTSRLKLVSYGKERPQCTEATEECWQKNRRVHFAVAEAEPQHLAVAATE